MKRVVPLLPDVILADESCRPERERRVASFTHPETSLKRTGTGERKADVSVEIDSV